MCRNYILTVNNSTTKGRNDLRLGKPILQSLKNIQIADIIR